MYKVNVIVTIKENVIDPQGTASKTALHSLDFKEVRDVRVGKFIQLLVEADSAEAAKQRAEEMCKSLLVNTVIEEYRVEVVEGNQAAGMEG